MSPSNAARSKQERERTNEELRRHREELRELVNDQHGEAQHEVESHAEARRNGRAREPGEVGLPRHDEP